MSKTINLGAVTAYADAVAAGYTGTREEFAQDLANAATYAAESHQSAETASAAAETASTAATTATTAASSASDDASTAHADAEAALSFKTASETAATTATTKAGEAANSASQAATSASGAAGSATAASGSATAAAGSATNAAASETAAAGSATAAAGSASAAAQTLVDVNAAGATQIAAIGAKGEEVLESIPSDYTTLSNDVDELKSELINYVPIYTDVPFSIENKRVKQTGDIQTSNGCYITEYYPCNPGMTVKFYGRDFYYDGHYVSCVIAFYDLNKTFLSGITQVSNDNISKVGTVTAISPTNTAYVIFCTNGNDTGFYAHVNDFEQENIASKADIDSVNKEITLTQDGAFVVTDIIQGSYNTSGAVTESNNRIRTNGFVRVSKGDTIHFSGGENVNQLLLGIFNTAMVFQRDSSWYNSGDIPIKADGYVIMLFRNSGNTAITPEDYDAFTELRKYFAINSIKAVSSDEWQSKLLNARHIYNNAGTPLTLLHFSDLHADEEALARIIDDAKNLSGIDDIICTGDMVGNTATQIESWWNPQVLTCIGNHDTASYSGGVYDWTALSMADRDAYYIAPFENHWGVVHTSGLSYYYKDYADQSVRLIVMDAMLYIGNTTATEAAAQTAWLENLLVDAITNSLHVLIAIHAPVNNAPVVDCSFSKYGRSNMAILNDCNTPQSVVDTVETAIGNGLNFVGYIVGHNHQDYIYKVTDSTQVGYCITCANTSSITQWKTSDQYRTNTDAFNLVTIDTTKTLIKLIRGGGADIDDHMRSRKAICFDYATGTMVGQVL